MQPRLFRFAGTCLILSALVMVITMIMHPSGGSIEHLQNISPLIIATHSLAIFSLPFALMGFWGLTRKLGTGYPATLLAFITMSFGVFAVMCAAITNGLALPFLVNHYRDATPEKIDWLKPVLNYNNSLNHAFDYVYIVANCTAISIWCFIILKTKSFPRWTAWLGLSLSLLVIFALSANMVLVDLQGFRLLIFVFVIWILVMGKELRRPTEGRKAPSDR